MFLSREMSHWRVQIQERSGQVIERDFSSYWDPEHVGTKEAVLKCTAIQHNLETKKECAPIGNPILCK
jgi:hypothetical protein